MGGYGALVYIGFGIHTDSHQTGPVYARFCQTWDGPGEARRMVKSHKYGLRTIAVFEASKGLAVIALCVFLLSLLHQDLSSVVDRVTEAFRLNPDSRFAEWLYELAERTTGRGIWTAASVMLAYSTVRFVEAYGLWNARHWAEWFAVISGAVYIPFEIYALFSHAGWTRLALLIGNVILVLYVASILLENRRERLQAQAAIAHKPSRHG